MIALTYAEVADLNPDPTYLHRAVELLGGEWTTPIDAETARRSGICLSDIVCILSRLAKRQPDVARRLGLWGGDCVAHVLHIFEHSHPTDGRPRRAIVARRGYARGEITLPEVVDAADAAAEAAIGAGAYAANASVDAHAAHAAVTYATTAFGSAAADAGAYAYAANAFAVVAAAAAANATERDWQFERLCARLSDNEPDDWPLMDREAA